MRLVKWNPYHNSVSFPFGIEKLFNEFDLDNKNSDSTWNPMVDITESKDQFELKAEIPGLKKEDINISFEDDKLTLSGERNREEEKDGKNYHRIERSYGKFQRSFQFPGNVSVDKIDAKYKNGILAVNIPKSEDAKPKEIAIN